MLTLDPASPLARALAADRSRYNALFAAARGTGATIDPAAFASVLAGELAPIADAVLSAAPDRLGAVVDGLYPIALDLLGRRLLGSETRHPGIADAWRRLLPALPLLVASRPVEVAGAVTNAVHALSGVPGTRPGVWIERMAELGPACADLAAFRDAGAVVAWHCGMAHLRPVALEAAARLPAAVGARSLGLRELTAAQVTAVLASLAQDPWLDPSRALDPPGGARELRIVARAGAFRGFGGPFIEPPTVCASGGALYASDRDGTWRLYADRFGTVFSRLERPDVALPPDGPALLRVDRAGRVVFAGLEAVLPECADPSSYATDGTTAAVTVRRSHAVVLVAVMDAVGQA